MLLLVVSLRILCRDAQSISKATLPVSWRDIQPS